MSDVAVDWSRRHCHCTHGSSAAVVVAVVAAVVASGVV